jgi:familyl 116 glycosyl hydrolase-like protein
VQLGLGEIYPRERVRQALSSLLKYNFHATFHGVEQTPRKFVADEDGGLQMIQWPKGGRPDPEHCIFYGDEVMTGFEYSAAAAMVQVGMLKEGLAVTRAIYDRYDGRLRTELTAADTASWGYSGNPFGDDECGKFYARAMSVWSLLLACQGFEYDGPAGHIGFAPEWQPEDHVSFFSAAEGWGTFRQERQGAAQHNAVEMVHGALGLTTLRLTLENGKQAQSVTVSINGNEVQSSFRQTDTRVLVSLGESAALSAGDRMEIRMAR